MRKRYKSTWWSIEMAPGWVAEADETCVTLICEDGFGALQISAYRRDDGAVTDEDLREFTEDELESGAGTRDVTLGKFLGLAVESFRHGTCWQKWWLRNGPLMLYVTYNCKKVYKGRERAIVIEMLSTLKSEISVRA